MTTLSLLQLFGPSLPARLRKRSKIRGECRLWMGAKTKAGYGLIGGPRASGLIYAHRAALCLALGSIPDDGFVIHTCDTPSCICPGHLRVSTPSGNSRDMARKERQPNRKLSAQAVSDIRANYRRHSPGSGLRAFAQKYSVSISAVSQARCAQSWREVR